MNLAYSELTKRIYIVNGNNKTDVTDEAMYLAFKKLKEIPPELDDQGVISYTQTIGPENERYEVKITKL